MLLQGTQQCRAYVEKATLLELLDSEQVQKLERHSDSAFVLTHSEYHHCPTPDCTNIVYYKTGPPIVDCFRCQRVSCLKCGVSPFHAGQTCEQAAMQRRRQDRFPQYIPSRVDCSRANEEAQYEFKTTDAAVMRAGLNIRTCRRCGNAIESSGGCLKMKCRCGYRFCFECGSENAQCNCTPSHHGFTDNVTGLGDFHGLRGEKSYTAHL